MQEHRAENRYMTAVMARWWTAGGKVGGRWEITELLPSFEMILSAMLNVICGAIHR